MRRPPAETCAGNQKIVQFMSQRPDSAIHDVVAAVANGRKQASEELLPLIYEELRRLAGARIAREPAGLTLQPTALVHEAYLRLIGSHDPGWDGAPHFFAAAAEAMRRILVERARHKARHRHGGAQRRVDLSQVDVSVEPPSHDMLALDEALRRLEAEDARKGQIVNLRYFAGLTVAETAAALDLSVGTIEREWRYIKTWLYAQLTDEPEFRN